MDFSSTLETLVRENQTDLNFTFCAVAKICLKSNRFDSAQYNLKQFHQITDQKICFDLASLSKPLINGFFALSYKEKLTNELVLLLNHQSGLPAYGRLGKEDWKSHLESFEVRESECLYSDYGAMRFLLDLSQKLSLRPRDEFKNFYQDTGLNFWLDLPATFDNGFYAPTGFREGRPIAGQAHDPNCYNIKHFCSHAGVFGSIDSLCRALIQLNKKFDLINEIPKSLNDQRFVLGFDRVLDTAKTLAGNGCSTKTFGHLGFTGTSFWIDAEKSIASVLLTNATEEYWYSRKFLTLLRKEFGAYCWS